jgi:hypothetical protein
MGEVVLISVTTQLDLNYTAGKRSVVEKRCSCKANRLKR